MMTEPERSSIKTIEDLSYRLCTAEMALSQAKVALNHPSDTGTSQAIAAIDRALSLRPHFTIPSEQLGLSSGVAVVR